MRYLWGVCLLLAVHTMAYGQVFRTRGRIVNALTGETLEGVGVRSLYTPATAVTGPDGRFVISTSVAGDTLVFSYTGFITQKRPFQEKEMIAALQPSETALSEVVVSASRERQLRREVPAAISKTGAAVIEETRATALYQLLNKTSGVYMVNLGNEQHTMAIRQPVTYNALYLYLEDGLPIRPTGIFNHNALYEINMNGLQDIEVIKGPASSLYGSNAVGGAVNFISRDPFLNPEGRASVQGDGYHYYRGDAAATFTSGKLGVYAAGYAARQQNSWQDYTDFDKFSGTLKAVYEWSNATRFTLSGTYSYLDTQTPGSLDSARFYSRGYASNQRFTYRRVHAFRASARADHRWNEHNASFITAFFRDNSTTQLPSYYIQDLRDQNGQYLRSAGQENEQRFNSFGVLLQHRADLSFLRSQLIAGMYLDNSPGSFYASYLDIHKDQNTNYYTSYTNTDSLIDNYRLNLFNTAAYVQYMIRPADALRVVAGLRYDRVSYDFRNRLPADRTRYKQQETNHYNVLAPKLGATYDLGKGRGVYANFSIGFQPPETSSLYSSRQTNALRQATFYNYEAGGWWPLADNKLKIEASLYDMEGRNEIISVLMPDNTTQNQNAGSTRHKGIEYTVLFQPAESWRLRFSGTNARHSYVSYSEISSGQTIRYDGNRMTNAPSFIANSELTWKPRFLDGFRMAVEWQHVGAYFVNTANSGVYGGYDLLNLRTGYDLRSAAVKGTGIWMHILNLTDQLYASTVTGNQYGVTYTASPPRTISVGISYTFLRQ